MPLSGYIPLFDAAITLHVKLPSFVDFDVSVPIYGKAPVDLFGSRINMGSMENNDYYAEVGDYIKEDAMFCPVGVCVANSSTTFADTVVITLETEDNESVIIADESSRPTFPSALTIPTLASHLRPRPEQYVFAERYGDTAEVKIHMGNIQPGRTEFSKEPFFVGASKACVLTMRATISANNLRLPGTVRCQHRLGGLLKCYHREAA